MGERGPVPRFTKQIYLQVSPEQYAWLKREAALQDTTMNDFIRAAIERSREQAAL